MQVCCYAIYKFMYEIKSSKELSHVHLERLAYTMQMPHLISFLFMWNLHLSPETTDNSFIRVSDQMK